MKQILPAIFFSMLFMESYAQLPYSQDFEATTFPPTGWQTFPIGSPINWEHDATVSGYGIGTACTSFDNFNTPAGSYYGIRLPIMNFTSVSQPYIRFDIAYAQRINSASDIFGLWWSPNGTSGWQNLINYSGASLVTAPATSVLFVPTASQWQTKTRSLSSLAGLPLVRLAIEDDCNHGNKIYFDNVIVFDSATVGINEIIYSNQLHVYPDPFSSFITIIPDEAQTIYRAGLYDITGSLVAAIEESNRIFRVENLSGLPEGIYFLRLDIQNEKPLFRKLIKIND
ncbi:MAG: T9SS type A sorting domain-containing protein [Bacteroidia bacterium]